MNRCGRAKIIQGEFYKTKFALQCLKQRWISAVEIIKLKEENRSIFLGLGQHMDIVEAVL